MTSAELRGFSAAEVLVYGPVAIKHAADRFWVVNTGCCIQEAF